MLKASVKKRNRVDLCRMMVLTKQPISRDLRGCITTRSRCRIMREPVASIRKAVKRKRKKSAFNKPAAKRTKLNKSSEDTTTDAAPKSRSKKKRPVKVLTRVKKRVNKKITRSTQTVKRKKSNTKLPTPTNIKKKKKKHSTNDKSNLEGLCKKCGKKSKELRQLPATKPNRRRKSDSGSGKPMDKNKQQWANLDLKGLPVVTRRLTRQYEEWKQKTGLWNQRDSTFASCYLSCGILTKNWDLRFGKLSQQPEMQQTSEMETSQKSEAHVKQSGAEGTPEDQSGAVADTTQMEVEEPEKNLWSIAHTEMLQEKHTCGQTLNKPPISAGVAMNVSEVNCFQNSNSKPDVTDNLNKIDDRLSDRLRQSLVVSSQPGEDVLNTNRDMIADPQGQDLLVSYQLEKDTNVNISSDCVPDHSGLDLIVSNLHDKAASLSKNGDGNTDQQCHSVLLSNQQQTLPTADSSPAPVEVTAMDHQETPNKETGVRTVTRQDVIKKKVNEEVSSDDRLPAGYVHRCKDGADSHRESQSITFRNVPPFNKQGEEEVSTVAVSSSVAQSAKKTSPRQNLDAEHKSKIDDVTMAPDAPNQSTERCNLNQTISTDPVRRIIPGTIHSPSAITHQQKHQESEEAESFSNMRTNAVSIHNSTIPETNGNNNHGYPLFCGSNASDDTCSSESVESISSSEFDSEYSLSTLESEESLEPINPFESTVSQRFEPNQRNKENGSSNPASGDVKPNFEEADRGRSHRLLPGTEATTSHSSRSKTRESGTIHWLKQNHSMEFDSVSEMKKSLGISRLQSQTQSPLRTTNLECNSMKKTVDSSQVKLKASEIHKSSKCKNESPRTVRNSRIISKNISRVDNFSTNLGVLSKSVPKLRDVGRHLSINRIVLRMEHATQTSPIVQNSCSILHCLKASADDLSALVDKCEDKQPKFNGSKHESSDLSNTGRGDHIPKNVNEVFRFKAGPTTTTSRRRISTNEALQSIGLGVYAHELPKQPAKWHRFDAYHRIKNLLSSQCC